jgi:hypothetical protein
MLTLSLPLFLAGAQDYSTLSVIIDDAGLFVIDADGRRAGTAGDGEQIEEIPSSYVYRDMIANDVTGEPAKTFTITVGIPQPAEGIYRVIVSGVKQTVSNLYVDAYATDGSRLPVIETPIDLEPGSVVEFELRFSPAPGATPELKRLSAP